MFEDEKKIHDHDHTHTHEHDHGHYHHHHDPNHTHPHTHDHSHEHEHSHGHEHRQKFPHVHANTKVVQNRLARAAGHLQRVRDMIDRGEDCSDVLQQLAAVIGALQSTGKIIMKDHLDHCVVDSIVAGDTQALEDFKKALDRFMA